MTQAVIFVSLLIRTRAKVTLNFFEIAALCVCVCVCVVVEDFYLYFGTVLSTSQSLAANGGYVTVCPVYSLCSLLLETDGESSRAV